MGQPVARQGDAISHGGTIIEGSQNVLTNGKRTARIGDKVLCALHQLQTIATGSRTVLVNGRGIARKGDAISCGATIVQGSANVLSG